MERGRIPINDNNNVVNFQEYLKWNEKTNTLESKILFSITDEGDAVLEGLYTLDDLEFILHILRKIQES